MSLFKDVLDVHELWLSKRGYTEKGLSSDDSPGDFIKRVQYAFGETIRINLWMYGEKTFQVSLAGRVGEKRQPIRFLFCYEYDPKKIKLYLRKLEAFGNSNKETFLITNNRWADLPFPEKVLDKLYPKPEKNILPKLKRPGVSNQFRRRM